VRTGFLFVAGLCVAAQAQVPAQVLTPTGTLRATFLAGNPVQATGVAADLTQELGKRLKVPIMVTGLPGVRAVIDSILNHTADIGFLAFDPTRATEVDFSQVYLLAWSSYLVPANSPVHSVAEADRAGFRIGAQAGDSPELFLSRNLKQAEIKRFRSVSAEDALRMLAAREIDAYAANRQRLLEIAAGAPNVRVVPDNFFAVQQAIIVPKGDRASLDAINKFLDEARASGLIQKAIDHAKLNGAADVNPRPGEASRAR
jgi:polar amino acid transport system substrate-binding protein